MSLAPFPSAFSPFLSSCWWQWCHCPAWWSFADSRGGSACLPASPGCERRPPAFPPAGQEPKERRGEGSDRPASRPLPARAALAASHTHLCPTNKACYNFSNFSFLLNIITSEKPVWLLHKQPGKQKYDPNLLRCSEDRFAWGRPPGNWMGVNKQKLNPVAPVLAPGVALLRRERSKSWCVRVGLAPAISLAVASCRNNWKKRGVRKKNRWREDRNKCWTLASWQTKPP